MKYKLLWYNTVYLKGKIEGDGYYEEEFTDTMSIQGNRLKGYEKIN